MGVARDRLVENYFGVVGWAYEPKFWRSREAMTKANCFITYIDDIYDVYGSLEELELFTEVVDRWDATAIEQLPNYMKICFMALFNTTNDTAYKTLKLKGVNPLLYLKKAVAGIAEVGREHYGVFPLKGKLLNVQEASHKHIMENAEIQNIKEILGLQHGKQYDSVKGLRYGHLMIMTDQDHDGSHIKGLLINFIHSFWPSLLKIKGFMVEFITPIVKATHRSGKVLAFYTIPEYEAWKESFSGHASGWSIKYYKGLGTSTKVKESMMESMVKFPHDLEPCVMPQPFSANELKVFLKRKADSITKVQI